MIKVSDVPNSDIKLHKIEMELLDFRIGCYGVLQHLNHVFVHRHLSILNGVKY